jgi:hypothetical protein
MEFGNEGARSMERDETTKPDRGMAAGRGRLSPAPDARAVLGHFARGIVSHFLEDFQFADATLRVE